MMHQQRVWRHFEDRRTREEGLDVDPSPGARGGGDDGSGGSMMGGGGGGVGVAGSKLHARVSTMCV